MAESCRKVLEVEIPPDIVKTRADEIAVEFQRRVRLPGFRPGKAPLSLVRQRFREDIRAELLRELVPEYVQTQAREHKWEPVGNPTVSDIEFNDDSPLKFKATMEVLPEIQLADYSDITVDVDEPEVADEEVQKTLEHLQEQGATYINLDPRPVADGDYASIAVKDYTASGEPAPGKTHELLCEIGGTNTLKEFTENLRGAQVGEEREFAVTYPEDFGEPRMAGKTVTYNVKVLGLKKKQVPELNDEFAKELGEFESLEAVRERIREDLLKSKQREADEKAKSELRKRLVELHDFAVPDALVDRQIEKRLDAFRHQIDTQGLNPQSLNLDWGKIRVSQREAAVEDVKSTLILERIAEANKLEVEPAELQKEIGKIAAATRQTPEAVEAHLTKNGGVDRMKSRLRIDKALEFVLNTVKKPALKTDR